MTKYIINPLREPNDIILLNEYGIKMTSNDLLLYS